MITGIDTLSAIQPGWLYTHHRRGADIGQTGIGANHPASADEQRLATRHLHNPGVRRSRRMQHRQDLVSAIDQFLQARRFWLRLFDHRCLPSADSLGDRISQAVEGLHLAWYSRIPGSNAKPFGFDKARSPSFALSLITIGQESALSK